MNRKKATQIPNVFEQSQGEFLLGREVTRGFIWRQRGSLDLKLHKNSSTGFTICRNRGGCGSNPVRAESMKIQPNNYEKVRFWMGPWKTTHLFFIFNLWTAVWTKCALSLLGNFCVLAKAYSATMTFRSDNLNFSFSFWFSWEKYQPNAHHRYSTTCACIRMLYTYICMYVCMYLCMHICLYVYMYISTHIHIYTYIYIYKYK